MKRCYVYIITNRYNSVLYVGFTGDLLTRMNEHKDGLNKGFSKRYNLSKLVYFEEYLDPGLAIDREKQLKAGSRNVKIELIESMNRDWRDLYEDLISV